jgi:hypothetical protein
METRPGAEPRALVHGRAGMRTQVIVVALLAIGAVAGLAALDAALGAAKGAPEASSFRVIPAAALLMVFLLHRPIDRI